MTISLVAGTRISKLKDSAINEALKSDCKFKHGALVIKGNRIICSAFNQSRTSFLGKIDYQQHAEMAVVTKFFNQIVRRDCGILKSLHKYTILVVRVPNDDDKQNERITVSSAPCAICAKRLYNLGFRRIAFSNDNNQIESTDLEYYTYKHFTSTHRRKLDLIKKNRFLRQKMDM